MRLTSGLFGLNWVIKKDLFWKGEVMGELKTGSKAPDFQLEDQDGRQVKLSDFKGRKLLLYFYPKANTSG